MSARSMMRRLRRGIGQAGYFGADRAALTFRIQLAVYPVLDAAALAEKGWPELWPKGLVIDDSDDALREASFWTKTASMRVAHGYPYLTFIVKSCYPYRMREFSKTAARFHDHFRTRGVVVRVMPGMGHG